MPSRFEALDLVRGTAVVMMIAFHVLWDARFFGVWHGNPYEGVFGLWQKAIATLFLWVVGVTLVLAQPAGQGRLDWFVKRVMRVGTAALAVSVVSWIFFPGTWIFFGILHLIAFSIALSVVLVDRPKWALVVGIGVFVLPWAFDVASLEIPALVWLGFSPPMTALDFFPVFPWFSAVCFGIFAGHALARWRAWTNFRAPSNVVTRGLRLLGQHALVVYLVHQPVLFALFFLGRAAGFS